MTEEETEKKINEIAGRAYENGSFGHAVVNQQYHLSACKWELSEICDRLDYFFKTASGIFDPPFVTEIYKIASMARKGIDPRNHMCAYSNGSQA